MEYEQLNQACSWVCETLMTLGAKIPPTHALLRDNTTVYNQPLHYRLDDFGRAVEKANPSAVTFSPPVANIPLSHSAIGDFAGIPPLAGLHSINTNANTDNSRHQVSKSAHHPYNNTISLLNRRKARQPAAAFEPNIIRLQARLLREGADQDAVKLVERVFSKEVTIEALARRQTREEAAQQVFGQGGGPVYLAFLEALPLSERDNSALWARFRCRLCPNIVDAPSWKHQRDVLRHLKRDHFGLADLCLQWYVFFARLRVPFFDLHLFGSVGNKSIPRAK
jgi:hypothetical protein